MPVSSTSRRIVGLRRAGIDVTPRHSNDTTPAEVIDEFLVYQIYERRIDRLLR